MLTVIENSDFQVIKRENIPEGIERCLIELDLLSLEVHLDELVSQSVGCVDFPVGSGTNGT